MYSERERTLEWEAGKQLAISIIEGYLLKRPAHPFHNPFQVGTPEYSDFLNGYMHGCSKYGKHNGPSNAS